METNLIMEAMKFMVLGMGVVFSFLIILIFVLKTQAALIAKFFPQKEKTPVANRSTSTATSTNSAKTAAIIAAVQHHKNLKG
jgi:oxaloacetate decarboxylase gamma subunit